MEKNDLQIVAKNTVTDYYLVPALEYQSIFYYRACTIEAGGHERGKENQQI